MKRKTGLTVSGAAAGAVNGFFGASGGMVLVPLLKSIGGVKEEELFPASLTVMVPVCLTSLLLSGERLPIQEAGPYLMGSLLGGILAGRIHIKPRLLHGLLGILILLGGGRLLWS